jgi:neutral ceramidase
VRAEFVGAYPNHDLHRGSTFTEVQGEVGDGWQRLADDGDWATRFGWRRSGRSGSRVWVTWDVPAEAAPGRYRLVYRGDVLPRSGTLRPFTAVTDAFEVR